MLEKLFTSKIRARLLVVFFISPKMRFNAHELANSLKENYSSVWKELLNLQKLGILKSDTQSGIKLYSINEKCPIINELQNIVIKTDGIGERIKESLQTQPEVKASFIFGSIASGFADSLSDINLMVIGKIKLQYFSSIISELENAVHRPVNYIIYSEDEWKEKKSQKDPFIKNIIEAPKIFIIGGEDDL